MRKRFFASFIAIAALAITASGYSNSSKCYINPGHGGHDSDDRPTDLPTELGFTGSQRFYESDGTLTRGKFLSAFLNNVGVSTKMSRTTNYSSDDLSLSTIAAQSNSYGGYFISLHSNAANNSANYVFRSIAVPALQIQLKKFRAQRSLPIPLLFSTTRIG